MDLSVSNGAVHRKRYPISQSVVVRYPWHWLMLGELHAALCTKIRCMTDACGQVDVQKESCAVTILTPATTGRFWHMLAGREHVHEKRWAPIKVRKNLSPLSGSVIVVLEPR
jgi:hypothetical protein